ncbi:hypothetical protein [Prevotella sp. OH937_COT-195]|uniref:hypothetical protein n=1 Tax=Prevotella sp. OH937_COT-195 TaxID=2491051 RepID=UPI000F6534C7|nr:hypothetical protein [Prevotella sp. OH937_COT-195]RRD02649.1 hypothetical protein EII32_01130 [Prevotella sp. OH937_COT-195]
MPLPLRFPTALARLLTSAKPLHLDAARYAFDETDAHLLNNRTKAVEGSNDRFGLNLFFIGNMPPKDISFSNFICTFAMHV